MVGPESKPRTGFNEVNNRSDDDKGKQAPGARNEKTNRLKEKNRRDADVKDRSVDPQKPSAAKKSPAAFAVANTTKGKEETEPMQPSVAPAKAKAPAKKAPAKAKAPAKKAPAKKAPAKAKAPAKKSPAAFAVANTTKGQEGGKNVFQERANKQKARKRPKNQRKVPLAPASTAAAETRSNARAEAKKNDSPVTDTPNKTYDKYISGSSDSNYVSEVVQAARDGNASAISRLKNDSGDLVDHHGMSEDEINEITG